jgi:hypothetical protein
MPSVSDLQRVRCALAHAVGVGSCAVTSDNLDTWMPKEPISHSLGLSVGEQVDDLVALKVHQDRAVTMTPTPGPVVNGKHKWSSNGLPARRGRDCHALQRVGADRHSDPCSQSRSGLATEDQRQISLQLTEPLRSTSIGCYIV